MEIPLTARMSRIVKALTVAPGVVLLSCGLAVAGEADVVGVEVVAQDGAYRFDVTVRHDDEGWDHYADRWEVLGEDGSVYGERLLAHPHENEQPFTRSQSGIVVPESVSEVIVRAHDKVHGFGGKEMRVKLPDR